MADNDDDLFASLGGSLMKDLLADLQGDDDDTGWLSLEQLEQELAQLNDNDKAPPLPMVPEQPVSAASLVVSSQPTAPSFATDSTTPQQDAWSASLERFTALGQDFLQADTERKQMQQPAMPPGFDLSQAQDYSITETVSVKPPPGMATPDQSQQVLQEAAARLVQQVQASSAAAAEKPVLFTIPKPGPLTPQNSLSVGPDGRVIQPAIPPRHVMPPTPVNSMATPTPPPSTPVVSKTAVQTGAAPPPLPTMPVTVPVAVPVANRTAWQTPPPMPQQQQPPQYMAPQPPMKLFCNPHPRAPPIPAQQLQGRYMKARDISYVVHSIMKPVLQAGLSDSDYDVQFLLRRGAPAAAGMAKNVKPSNVDEMASRETKAKEWSDKHATLGHVSKTNVSRPRALLADPIQTTQRETSDSDNKQRAVLWKARIYADQANQAYLAVVESWRSVPPGQVPATVQPHLIKLLKCLGVTHKQDKYETDATALPLLLKLPKGRVLLARVLEQALLPPAAVQALLPEVLTVLYERKDTSGEPTSSDDRLFVALARVLQTLPNLSGPVLLECLQVVQSHASTALGTQPRMQCVHVILQRGGVVAASDADFEQTWKPAEAEFMKILAGM